MLFNSLEFLVFFAIVVAAYFAIHHKYRWVLLLTASYYFYMCWDYRYVLLILATTTVNYLSGIHIYRTNNKKLKNFYLVLGLVTSLGILFFFKYFNFFGDSINFLFSKFNIFYRVPAYHFLLPVGISFYTFQTLSYTIEVYKNKQEPEYHFGIFALYVSFFPQLVAGPIERSTNLLPQLYKKVEFSYSRIRDGILFMLWGFFKKVVIADRLSEYVNIVYNNPKDHSGIQLVLGTVFFAFQIYCDFSGYSDIAIGSAKIMGIDLMTNFNRPYLSKSIQEFWRRWHISLSTWFRDYLYIPLGGSRVAKWRWQYNLFITFLISGLWHGANWTFVIWGALHGFYMIFAIWTAKIREKINSFIFGKKEYLFKISQVITTIFLAWFAWIFFRANSFGEAILIIKRIFIPSTGELNLFSNKSDFILALFLIGLLSVVEILEERIQLYSLLKKQIKPIKWIILLFILFAIIVLGKWESIDFLYFQF